MLNARMRRLFPFAVLLGVAAPMMVAWEMAQAALYSDMAGLSWRAGASRCLVAAAGDLVILLGAALIPAALMRRLDWICLPGALPPIMLTGIAFAISTGFERQALSASNWEYATSMPLVPILEIGLSPALQWLVVPALSAFAARHFCRCPS